MLEAPARIPRKAQNISCAAGPNPNNTLGEREFRQHRRLGTLPRTYLSWGDANFTRENPGLWDH